MGKTKTLGKKHVMKNGYVRIQTEQGWVYEHQYVWEQHYGKIPNGFVIHHIDHNRKNNNINNLTLLPKKRHDSLTSYEYWEKVKSGILSKRKMPNQKDFNKQIILNLLEKGLSVRDIAKYFNVSHSTIRRNLRDYNIILEFDKSAIAVSPEHVETLIEFDKDKIIVKRYIKDGYVPINQRKSIHKNKSVITKELLLNEIATGKSYRQIAKDLGVSHTTISKKVKEFGL